MDAGPGVWLVHTFSFPYGCHCPPGPFCVGYCFLRPFDAEQSYDTPRPSGSNPALVIRYSSCRALSKSSLFLAPLI